jgi:small subunit ribosomal protein S3Ae
MAYGKNKGLNAKGKKGGKKKQLDPFIRKNWYDIKAPTYFSGKRKVGRTPVTKTTGQVIETEMIKNRICEFNLADLSDIQDDGFKKIKLEIQETQGRNCLTDFHGMSFTRDKLCQLVKKRHTLVECWVDCKTTDGFVVRVFVLAFTAKVDSPDQGTVKQACYAQSAQIKRIRKKMTQVLQAEVGKGPLKDMVKAITVSNDGGGKYEKAIKSATHRIFPLTVHVNKVKVIKKPKVDIVRLFEIHEKGDADTGAAVDEPAEAKNLLKA